MTAQAAFRPGTAVFGLLAIAFLVAPLLMVVVFSFGSNANATLPFGTPTTAWYAALFANPAFAPALYNSLIVTLATGVMSMVTGLLAALALVRMKPSQAGVVLTLLSLPVMLPPLVLALALAVSFTSAGIPLGLWTVIPSHLAFTQPFVILILYAQLERFDHSVLDSARDLGASPLTAFRTVTLPLIAPTLIGATLIAMSISLDDFVITFFTIGTDMTLPTMVWGMLRTSLDPSINALGTLVLLATVGSSLIAIKVARYRG